MKRALKPEVAAAMIPDGAVLMIGGFMGVGRPIVAFLMRWLRGARRG